MTCCKDPSHPQKSHCRWHTLFGVCSYPTSIPVGWGGAPPVVTPVGVGGGGGKHSNTVPEMLSEAVERFWDEPTFASFSALITVLGNEGFYGDALGAAEYAKKQSHTADEYAEAVGLQTNLLKQVAEDYEAGVHDSMTTLNTLPPEYASEVWKRLRVSAEGSTVVDPIEIETVLTDMPGTVNISELAGDMAERWNSQIALGRLLVAP